MENPVTCCRYILAIRFWIFSFVPVFGFLFRTHLIEGNAGFHLVGKTLWICWRRVYSCGRPCGFQTSQLRGSEHLTHSSFVVCGLGTEWSQNRCFSLWGLEGDRPGTAPVLLWRWLLSLSVRLRRWHPLCYFPSSVAVALTAYRVLLMLPCMFLLFHLNQHPPALGSWVPWGCANFPIVPPSLSLSLFWCHCWNAAGNVLIQLRLRVPGHLLESGFFLCALLVLTVKLAAG